VFGISCKSDTDFLIQSITIVFETGKSSDEGFACIFAEPRCLISPALPNISPSWNPTIVVGSSTLVYFGADD
jgi:hypothetical protein